MIKREVIENLSLPSNLIQTLLKLYDKAVTIPEITTIKYNKQILSFECAYQNYRGQMNLNLHNHIDYIMRNINLFDWIFDRFNITCLRLCTEMDGNNDKDLKKTYTIIYNNKKLLDILDEVGTLWETKEYNNAEEVFEFTMIADNNLELSLKLDIYRPQDFIDNYNSLRTFIRNYKFTEILK